MTFLRNPQPPATTVTSPSDTGTGIVTLTDPATGAVKPMALSDLLSAEAFGVADFPAPAALAGSMRVLIDDGTGHNWSVSLADLTALISNGQTTPGAYLGGGAAGSAVASILFSPIGQATAGQSLTIQGTFLNEPVVAPTLTWAFNLGAQQGTFQALPAGAQITRTSWAFTVPSTAFGGAAPAVTISLKDQNGVVGTSNSFSVVAAVGGSGGGGTPAPTTFGNGTSYAQRGAGSVSATMPAFNVRIGGSVEMAARIRPPGGVLHGILGVPGAIGWYIDQRSILGIQVQGAITGGGDLGGSAHPNGGWFKFGMHGTTLTSWTSPDGSDGSWVADGQAFDTSSSAAPASDGTQPVSTFMDLYAAKVWVDGTLVLAVDFSQGLAAGFSGVVPDTVGSRNWTIASPSVIVAG